MRKKNDLTYFFFFCFTYHVAQWKDDEGLGQESYQGCCVSLYQEEEDEGNIYPNTCVI